MGGGKGGGGGSGGYIGRRYDPNTGTFADTQTGKPAQTDKSQFTRSTARPGEGEQAGYQGKEMAAEGYTANMMSAMAERAMEYGQYGMALGPAAAAMAAIAGMAHEASIIDGEMSATGRERSQSIGARPGGYKNTSVGPRQRSQTYGYGYGSLLGDYEDAGGRDNDPSGSGEFGDRESSPGGMGGV